MKKAYIVVGLIVAVGLVWFVFSRQSGDSSTNPSVNETDFPVGAKTDPGIKEPQVALITYTDSGFSPTTVLINAGDSVAFKNESSRTFQPATDPHPVHTGLSGFDARTAVPVGQTYTFTFDQSGSWGFHDHLDSAKKGTVVVR